MNPIFGWSLASSRITTLSFAKQMRDAAANGCSWCWRILRRMRSCALTCEVWLVCNLAWDTSCPVSKLSWLSFHTFVRQRVRDGNVQSNKHEKINSHDHQQEPQASQVWSLLPAILLECTLHDKSSIITGLPNTPVLFCTLVSVVCRRRRL